MGESDRLKGKIKREQAAPLPTTAPQAMRHLLFTKSLQKLPEARRVMETVSDV